MCATLGRAKGPCAPGQGRSRVIVYGLCGECAARADALAPVVEAEIRRLMEQAGE